MFTATKGPAARGLAAWMAWASSSLPVPVSPRISTGELARAARRALSLTATQRGLAPTKLVKVYLLRRASSSLRRVSASSRRMLWKRETSGMSWRGSSKIITPTPPMSSPAASRTGSRMTTKDSLPNSMMSSMIGLPLLTTLRIRLLGITSSTGRPITEAGSAMPRWRGYFSLIQTIRACRSTISIPSESSEKAAMRVSMVRWRMRSASAEKWGVGMLFCLLG